MSQIVLDKLPDIDFVNSTISFPNKLYTLLEQGHDSIIQWTPSGLSFRIQDPNAFSLELMPKYFKQTKLTSFQRQLNLYGFRRLNKGEDQGGYFHPKFQKGQRDLLSEVKRLPERGTLCTYEDIVKASNQPNPSNSNKRRRETEEEQFVPSKPLHRQTESFFNSDIQIALEAKQGTATLYPLYNFKLPGGGFPLTKSKLTMNIGFGRSIVPACKNWSNVPIVPSTIPINSNFAPEATQTVIVPKGKLVLNSSNFSNIDSILECSDETEGSLDDFDILSAFDDNASPNTFTFSFSDINDKSMNKNYLDIV